MINQHRKAITSHRWPFKPVPVPKKKPSPKRVLVFLQGLVSLLIDMRRKSPINPVANHEVANCRPRTCHLQIQNFSPRTGTASTSRGPCQSQILLFGPCSYKLLLSHLDFLIPPLHLLGSTSPPTSHLFCSTVFPFNRTP